MKFLPLYLLIVCTWSYFPDNTLFAQDTTKTKDTKTSAEHKQQFIDKDGDGYNDNAPDHDGDGIPNGLDPDWQKLKQEQKKKQKRRFVDLDGDGIDDNLMKEESKEMGKQQMQNRERGSAMGKQSQNGQNREKKKQAGKN